MKHSTGKPTSAQKLRLNAISRMDCRACSLEEQKQPNRTEVHHLVDKGTRELSGGHDATIPLCSWHHRGITTRGYNDETMTTLYGPSLATRKKAFVRRYGTERVLLEYVDKVVDEMLDRISNQRAEGM